MLWYFWIWMSGKTSSLLFGLYSNFLGPTIGRPDRSRKGKFSVIICQRSIWFLPPQSAFAGLYLLSWRMMENAVNLWIPKNRWLGKWTANGRLREIVFDRYSDYSWLRAMLLGNRNLSIRQIMMYYHWLEQIGTSGSCIKLQLDHLRSEAAWPLQTKSRLSEPNNSSPTKHDVLPCQCAVRLP